MITLHRDDVETVTWPPGSEGTLAMPAHVDVWSAALDCPPDQRELLWRILDMDEQSRADRFRHDRDRNRFITARGFVRIVLSRYVRTKPEEVTFVYGENGKPSLGSRWQRRRLYFNLAHSHGIAVLGLTRLGPIGIDIEQIRPLKEAEELVARFFSPREAVAFKLLSPGEKEAAFFRLWTCKEAWLKAVGQGIGHLLNQVEVSFLPDETVRLLRVPQAFGPLEEWSLAELSPTKGYAGALSVRAPSVRARYWHWDPARGKGPL